MSDQHLPTLETARYNAVAALHLLDRAQRVYTQCVAILQAVRQSEAGKEQQIQKINALLQSASYVSVWAPLQAKMPEDQWIDFTFMATVNVSGTYIHCYRHWLTRHYLNIDATGQCYAYQNDTYIPITDEKAFAHAHDQRAIEPISNELPVLTAELSLCGA